MYSYFVLNNSDSVSTGKLISLTKQINQIYSNSWMQSQSINLVKNAIKIQTTRKEKKKHGIKGKQSFLTKERVFWENMML